MRFKVREYEDKFDKLEKNFDATKKEMAALKDQVKGLMGNLVKTRLMQINDWKR